MHRNMSAPTTVDDKVQPIDRIFLSIAAHHDSLAPDIRVRTIYPRYLEQNSTPVEDGLTMRAFRDGSPYSSEDLFRPQRRTSPRAARATPTTPGMCLSERRIDGADLTFRFPRSWLAQWRDVADAMERLTVQLRGPRRVSARRARYLEKMWARCASRSQPCSDQILLEDRHLELERAIVVLVIDEQHADELLADIDLRRIVLLRPRHDADFRIAEQTLEIGVKLPDFLNVHGSLQYDLMVFGKCLGRDDATARPFRLRQQSYIRANFARSER